MPSPNPFALGTASQPLLPHSVIVITDDSSCAKGLEQALTACNVSIRYATQAESIVTDLCAVPGVAALVALAIQPERRSKGLATIRDLNQHRIPVIAFAEQSDTWPLGIRCQALLAGAMRLLDSTQEDFLQVLIGHLFCLFDEIETRDAAQNALQQEMKQLGVIAQSPSMLAIAEQIKRVGGLSDLAVLLTGETGTGKEVIARAIHQLDGKRKHGAFIPLNCSALNSNLAESELFGHKRGAFTGAERDRRGLFRAAQGGVLFLDEIGELDLTLQAKLLRALQENRILAVGDEQETPVNVRVIAATNRDLPAMIAAGKFRSDLFYRLNLVSLHLPPLRERAEDIEVLTQHFLQKYGASCGATACSLSADFLAALRLMKWPGNVRQLENLLRYILVSKHDAEAFCLSDFPPEVWAQLAQQEPTSEEATGDTLPDMEQTISHLLNQPKVSLTQSVAYYEKLLLESALQRAYGNQTKAAKMLGLTPRSIYNKMRKYHLHP